MSGLKTAADVRHRRATARAVASARRLDDVRLDDVWGPVGRRSGMVVAGFVLLLLSLGILLLDAATNPYPRPVHGSDRVTAVPSGELTRVAGHSTGVRFELSLR